MGLVTVNRVKAKGIFYFIVCKDFESALVISEKLASFIGNQFVNVIEFKSREELIMYCESIIIK